MFAGGGAVLPQQMMPPQQSGGILASSGPLLDAVAAGAVNPDGDGGASLRTLRPLTPLAVPWWISVLMNQKPLTLVL